MKINRSITKSTKYFITNYNGIEIHLITPKAESKDQKYYLQYKSTTQKKYYGNGNIQRIAKEYFMGLSTEIELSHSQIEANLTELFKQDLEIIIHELQSKPNRSIVTMRMSIYDAFLKFYEFKTKQVEEGTLEKRTLTNYGQHHRKLLTFFGNEATKKYTLMDLSSDLWVNYRIDIIKSISNKNKDKLRNTSINQHFQYITQYYGWLIDYLELPIKNHLKKLNKLNEAKQIKRFKIIPSKLFNEFYHILETVEKYNYTRLYLSGLLLYENNIRLSEQVLIQIKDIHIAEGYLTVLNKKNDSRRNILMSAKVKELIQIIDCNTRNRGLNINDNMYLFGGHNIFKVGTPHSYKELGTLMRRFRKAYPQFKEITLYEQKHTSITNQFDDGIDHFTIKERANHSSISTTEIYLQSKRAIKPYEYKSSIDVMGNDES